VAIGAKQEFSCKFAFLMFHDTFLFYISIIILWRAKTGGPKIALLVLAFWKYFGDM
jgi:hypothetical protein